MAIHFIGEIDKQKFIEGHMNLYRVIPIKRLKQSIETQSIRFSNPEEWKDPYEKYFLNCIFPYQKNSGKLPIKNKIFALCFSKRYNSEAFWNVYTPDNDGVRLKIDSKKLYTQLKKLTEVDIFIGEVSYITTNEFAKAPSKIIGLRNEIESNKVGPLQIQLMLKKRKSFLYEEEIRVFVVTKSHETKFEINHDIKKITTKFDLDPRMEQDDYSFYRNELIKYYSIEKENIGKSILYKQPRWYIFKKDDLT